MGCTIVFQIIRGSSILHRRSNISKLSRLLYKWLFSDLLYKQKTLILIKWYPESTTFFITITKQNDLFKNTYYKIRS